MTQDEACGRGNSQGIRVRLRLFSITREGRELIFAKEAEFTAKAMDEASA